MKINNDNKPYFITEPHLRYAGNYYPGNLRRPGWSIRIRISQADLSQINETAQAQGRRKEIHNGSLIYFGKSSGRNTTGKFV
jgi:hypothetical protein